MLILKDTIRNPDVKQRNLKTRNQSINTPQKPQLARLPLRRRGRTAERVKSCSRHTADGSRARSGTLRLLARARSSATARELEQTARRQGLGQPFQGFACLAVTAPSGSKRRRWCGCFRSEPRARATQEKGREAETSPKRGQKTGGGLFPISNLQQLRLAHSPLFRRREGDSAAEVSQQAWSCVV